MWDSLKPILIVLYFMPRYVVINVVNFLLKKTTQHYILVEYIFLLYVSIIIISF